MNLLEPGQMGDVKRHDNPDDVLKQPNSSNALRYLTRTHPFGEFAEGNRIVAKHDEPQTYLR